MRPRVRSFCTLRTRASFSALAAVLLLAGCDLKKEANTAPPPPPPEVFVANPVEKPVTQYLTYTGTTEASMTVELRARVQGFLEKVHFKPGQRVAKDDLLFTIDKRQYQNAVDQSKARIVSLTAALATSENEAKLARELADQNAGPAIDAVIKAGKVDEIKGNISAAQAALADALLNLDYCEIRSPIAGHITKNFVDEGNLVGRGEPTLLAKVVLSQPLFVSVDISEGDVLALRRNEKPMPADTAAADPRPVELALADQSDFPYTGKIDYVEPELNTSTGTLRVRMRFENSDDRLLPGFFSRVRCAIETTPSVLVPDAALLSDQVGRFAYVVEDDDKVAMRRVKIGALDGEMRVVQEGLSTDDRVIVSGLLRARPGSAVTAKTAEPAEATKKAPKTKKPAAEKTPEKPAKH